jgi:hypothetical protein
MNLLNRTIPAFETKQQDDGRWRASVPLLVGEVVAYGATELEALGKAKDLALEALAASWSGGA